MTEFETPPLRIDKDGVHIVSEEVAEKLRKKSISPSLITGLDQCPAKWVSESLVLRDFLEEEPDNPARRGSLFHKVMEDFFAYPPEERTKEKVKEVFDEVLDSDEFKDMKEIPEAVEWLKSAINGYYTMGARPEAVKVATIDSDRGERVGLEVFVKGKIGESSREVLGFIDRVIEDPRDSDSLVVEDWKTSAKVRKWKKNNKNDDGLPEARQQILYKELLEGQGMKVSAARLIYPVAEEIVDVDLKDKQLRERVISDVEEADAKLDHFIEENTFEFKPSYLCAWCPVSKICPAATIKPYKKMQDAYKKQPNIEILSEVFSFDD